MKRKYLLIVITLNITTAYAYRSKDDVNIFVDRTSPDYAQQGIHAGGFTVSPSFTTGEQYSDNVLYQNGKKSGDFATHIRPIVDVKSNWSRHALNFNFNGDIAEYAKLGNQANYHDVQTGVDGQFDITRNSYFSANVGYNMLHQLRNSVDQINSLGTSYYNTKVMSGYYNHEFNRVTIKTGVDALRSDYDNTTSSTGSLLQMQSRSGLVYTPSIRLGYELQSEYEAFIKIASRQVVYDSAVLSNGSGTAYNRNSSGYNATGGLAFELTDLITGNISMGYLDRTYQDARFKEISGVNGFLNLRWRPTALTTVTNQISRDINETTQVGVSGVLSSLINVGLEHELKRNILLRTSVNYNMLDYQGYDKTNVIAQDQKNRVDNQYGGSLGAQYLLNRYLNTDLTYTYQSRASNYNTTTYDAYQIMLNLRGQF